MLLSRAWLRVLSAFFVNLAATWFGATFITINFVNLSSTEAISLLIRNIFSGILCLLVSVKIEEFLES